MRVTNSEFANNLGFSGVKCYESNVENFRIYISKGTTNSYSPEMKIHPNIEGYSITIYSFNVGFEFSIFDDGIDWVMYKFITELIKLREDKKIINYLFGWNKVDIYSILQKTYDSGIVAGQNNIKQKFHSLMDI